MANLSKMTDAQLKSQLSKLKKIVARTSNDVAKAKDESTTSYFVQTIEIPSLTKEVYDDDIPF